MSCKKEKETVPPPPPPVSTTPTIPKEDILKDSALFYSRDIYLWNEQIPATFNAKNYSDLEKVMLAIRPYSVEAGFADPVDRFSFAIKQTEWDAMSEGMGTTSTTTGTEGDFGMTVFFRVEGDLRVRLVEPLSPAGLAGIKRGWRITKINGNTDITTANSDFIVDNIYDAATAKVTFLKPDGSTVELDLARGHYHEKAVYLDSVYTISNKKIGYLVFNSFLGNTADIQDEFQRVFSKFGSAGVTEVVMDLRYNGGGYVSLQQKLANYLVSTSANGGVMMNQVYNNANAVNNETTKFKKEGTLNLSRVYFIVSNATASASELLINNLRPYMDVKLIGANTYGKPVGFFPIPVGEWYIFPVSFRSTNKNGEGNYFNGLTVNAKVADGLDKDWGDITEARLASAIKNITTGSFRVAAEPEYQEPAAIAKGNKTLDAPFLKITVGETRPQ
ncbi:MAG: S41 family peptidase [Ferruginibacter sp.]|nr:S41 family peptidase [Ferruginibacter sp.]